MSKTNANDMGRDFLLDVCAAGTVHIRKRGERGGPKGLLPVYSTDTREEAESLRVLLCRLARDGSGLYTLNNPPNGVDDLDRVSSLMRDTHAMMKKKDRERRANAAG